MHRNKPNITYCFILAFFFSFCFGLVISSRLNITCRHPYASFVFAMIAKYILEWTINNLCPRTDAQLLKSHYYEYACACICVKLYLHVRSVCSSFKASLDALAVGGAYIAPNASIDVFHSWPIQAETKFLHHCRRQSPKNTRASPNSCMYWPKTPWPNIWFQ